jgi:heavy metal sensor kinase
MAIRTRSLQGTVSLFAFLFEAILLLGCFATIDVMLSRSLRKELRRAAGEELHGLEDFIVQHEPGGRDYLLDEMNEHLSSRTDVAVEVRDGSEILFRSTSFPQEGSPEPDARFLGSVHDVFWVEGAAFRGFDLKVAVPAREQLLARSSWRTAMAFCSLGGLVVAALLARTLARQATLPLAAIGRAAERIHDKNLSERLPPPPRPYDEVESVRSSFNGMLDRLEGALQKLCQFTADASHELRTPLAVLKVQAQTALASGDLDPASAALVGSQLEEIDRLTFMVEDLLTLARLESGAEEVSAVDVSDVVLETVEHFRALAESKGVGLAVSDVEPAGLDGELSQIRRLVSNLIDNALKYTEPGGRVWVELGRNDDVVRLVVADTGRGIPENDLPRIFERFYRADPSRSRVTGGAGLGLAIVARIVQFHCGTISVQSELGKGTSFTVDLPSRVDASGGARFSP